MKRSEFVYQLAGYLSTHQTYSNMHPGSVLVLSLAEHITSYLERQDILPKMPQGTNFAPSWTPESEVAIRFGEDHLD